MDKKKITLSGLIILIMVLLVDFTLKRISFAGNITIIPNVLSLSYAENFRLTTSTIIIDLLLMLLVVGLIIYYTKKKSKSAISLYMILAGETGNVLDRLINGYVTDYIKIFNNSAITISDISIRVGIIALVICVIKYFMKKK